MVNTDRVEIARLVHRFGFGPKPGEYAQLVNAGLKSSQQQILTPSSVDQGLSKVADLALTDLGPFPPQKSAAAASFESARTQQILALQLWWLDRMACADNALTERMTWFWHGHWATAVGKVEYALPMYMQNQLLRNTALGNFRDQARAMMTDSALLYWLDGNSNVAGSPNENLAREFMELFTLGVGAYTELDIQQISKALTGYNTVRSAGTVSFNPKKHDSSVLTFLGTTGKFDAPAVSDYLTTLPANQDFIARRIWFRFISSTDSIIDANTLAAFSNRDILQLVQAVATSTGMSNPVHSQSKSPVEWFISVCRALGVTPSTLTHSANVIHFLNTMGQVPFDPPNVGGWPTDEAWLNISSMQARLAFSKYIISQVKLDALNALPYTDERITYLADLLGVSTWSTRTKSVFRTSLSNPAQLVLIAINAPEYVVSA
jgi:uncharacterized protein (DUF1800 family)